MRLEFEPQMNKGECGLTPSLALPLRGGENEAGEFVRLAAVGGGVYG